MKLALALFFTAGLLAAGCSNEKRSTELLETARFEEKQNNREHAAKLYDEIIRKYPNSPAAAAAKARLSEIRP